MKSILGQRHARVIALATDCAQRARLEQLAIDCLMRAYDKTGDLNAYLDAESLWEAQRAAA